jgi:hypothetical protein
VIYSSLFYLGAMRIREKDVAGEFAGSLDGTSLDGWKTAGRKELESTHLDEI